MEKRINEPNTANIQYRMTKFIVLTGPESTAKSTLTQALAAHYHAPFYPEYAREYLSAKQGAYCFNDVEQIARGQIGQYDEAIRSGAGLVFLDTWLIITKVWFEWSYHRVPHWLESSLADRPVDLYLLCRPDIPWEPDPLREHGGEQRKQLFDRYKSELNTGGFAFSEVYGLGEARLFSAVSAINGKLQL